MLRKRPVRSMLAVLFCLPLLALPAAGQAPAGSGRVTLPLRAADLFEIARTAETAEPGTAYQGFCRLASGGLPLADRDVLAFEENKWFVSIVASPALAGGPAGESQPAGSSPRWTRRVLFLKPSVFVIDDEVAGMGLGRPVAFSLVPGGPAEARGRMIRVTQGDWRLTSTRLWPPDGVLPQVVESGGQAARVDVPWSGGQARAVQRVFVVRGERARGPRLQIEEKEARLHAELVSGDRVFRLTLPKWSVSAGEVAVADPGGKSLLDSRPLPAGVLPHTAEGLRLIERWDSAYRGGGRPGWDVGRPASDLVQAVESGTLRPCRVVELGCGSGTNAIYLAEKGFDVTAMDIAPAALGVAGQKAAKAGVKVRWLLADVLAPPRLEPFELIFDRGCYHGVRGQNAAGYVETVRRLSRPGTLLLILAGNANEKSSGGPPRVTEAQLRGDFSKLFDFVDLRETHFDTPTPGGKGALAWFALLKRKGGD